VNQVTPASLRYPLSVFNKNSTLRLSSLGSMADKGMYGSFPGHAVSLGVGSLASSDFKLHISFPTVPDACLPTVSASCCVENRPQHSYW